MSAEPAREFVDANVLVYAFDPSAKSKQAAAAQVLERLWDSGNGCLSVQVLQEFFVTVTRKVARPLSIDEAEDRVREFTTWKGVRAGRRGCIGGNHASQTSTDQLLGCDGRSGGRGIGM